MVFVPKETWMIKAGPTDEEYSKKAFEEWWERCKYLEWLPSWDETDKAKAKYIAFDAWEHQRKMFKNMITTIFEIIEKGL